MLIWGGKVIRFCSLGDFTCENLVRWFLGILKRSATLRRELDFSSFSLLFFT